MKYKQVKNLKWANTEHTIINCEVDFDDLIDEFVPFTAASTDMYSHTVEIFNKAVLGEFGSIAEYVEPPIVEPEISIPDVITMRQARLQLLAIGLLDDVEVVIANIEDATMKRMVQIEWEYAKDVERDSTTIVMLAQAIGMDEEALNNLFIEAVKL